MVTCCCQCCLATAEFVTTAVAAATNAAGGLQVAEYSPRLSGLIAGGRSLSVVVSYSVARCGVLSPYA
jgi:hypothetical protein